MPSYRFEPAACVTEMGITWRPFLVEGQEIYRMKMSVMLGEDKDAADREMSQLCDKIKEVTGVAVTPEQLPTLLRNRKIEY